MQNHNLARERYRLRRNFYRDRFARILADEETTTIDPELVRQVDLMARQMAAENEQLREALKRHKADFDNFRRRTLKEKEQLRDAAKEALLVNLLPVLDNFERAVASAKTATDVETLRRGIEMVADQLTSILGQEGLERFDPTGEPFDPTLHEALTVEENSEVPDGQIIEVLRPGYRFKDHVIRPALVKVAKNPAGASSR